MLENAEKVQASVERRYTGLPMPAKAARMSAQECLLRAGERNGRALPAIDDRGSPSSPKRLRETYYSVAGRDRIRAAGAERGDQFRPGADGQDRRKRLDTISRLERKYGPSAGRGASPFGSIRAANGWKRFRADDQRALELKTRIKDRRDTRLASLRRSLTRSQQSSSLLSSKGRILEQLKRSGHGA